MMKNIIELAGGTFALVDEEDFERVNQFKWHKAGDRGASSVVSIEMRKQLSACKTKSIYMHRFILCLVDTSLPVIHLNRNTYDNRKSNLKYTSTHQAASRRKRKAKTNRFGGKPTSCYKGVCWGRHANKWIVQCTRGIGIPIHVGCFENEVEAAFAYDEAALEHFGNDVWLNIDHFPELVQS